MKGLSTFSRVALALYVAWPFALLLFLDDALLAWVLAVTQVTLFGALLAGSIEVTVARSPAALPLVLALAVLAGILVHAVYYVEMGLVTTGSGQVVHPSLGDALYFSIVTFTTLGYGDMAPREEYRLFSAFQAIYGYVFLGALVGTLVTVLGAATRLPRRQS